MAFCSNCGKPVSSPFCTNCGTKAVPRTVTSQPPASDEPGVPIDAHVDGTYRMAPPQTQPAPSSPFVATGAPDGFFRTPFQVAVLSFATLGLYGIYWLIRGRRIAEKYLGDEITSYWWYLFWLIPIVALVSGIMSASKIERRCIASGIRAPRISFALLTFFFFVSDATWRLPDPYWFFSCVVPPIFIAAMQSTVSKAERADYPTHAHPKFTVWEWLITILGGLFLLLAIAGTFTGLTTPTQVYYMIGIVVLIAATLVTYAALSRD